MKKCIPVSVIFILSIVFTSTVFAHYEHFKIPTATITIDGNMDDWNNIEPVFVDDINDEDQMPTMRVQTYTSSIWRRMIHFYIS